MTVKHEDILNDRLIVEVSNKLSGYKPPFENGIPVTQLTMRNVFVDVIREYCDAYVKLKEGEGSSND